MKRHKKTNWYMHTLEERPAYFYRDPTRGGGQIVYVGGLDEAAVLVDSIHKIRRQQRLSREFRTKQGWDIPDYDYVRVVVPKGFVRNV